MEEITVKIDIPAEWKDEFKIALAKAIKDLVEMTKMQLLKERINSEEEKELTKWSVELGRKAKKESFKNLLQKLDKKKRKELLNAMSPEKRKEYE